LDMALRLVGHNSIGDGQRQAVPLDVFTRLWQGLMLGILSLRELQEEPEVYTNIRIIKYDRRHSTENVMSKDQWLFETDWLEDDNKVHWVRIDKGNFDHWKVLGAKAFLNPLATNDAMNTAREGMTKIRRYRHQYIVCLEVYIMKPERTGLSPVPAEARAISRGSDVSSSALSELEDQKQRCTPCCCGTSGVGHHRQDVKSRVLRSVLLMVATGRQDFKKGRQRLITLAMTTNPIEEDDPLDRFETNAAAANVVLDKVHNQLNSEYGLREHDADHLLLAIIHSTVDLNSPVLVEYGKRLQELKKRLQDLKGSAADVHEVSKMSLEFEELGQWIKQCRAICENLSGDSLPEGAASNTSFGASEKDGDLQIHLLDTKDLVQQLQDRLDVLGKMAASFLADHQRDLDNRMNLTMNSLTVVTFVAMPFQILAGVYGMNFVRRDGTPGIPELTQGQTGYWSFWIACTALAVVFVVVLCLVQTCGLYYLKCQKRLYEH